MALGRPLLRTAYSQDVAIFPTWFQRIGVSLLGAYLFLQVFAPFGSVSLINFFGERPFTNMMIFAIAALGINILVGVTGQVSLGHAFFMGVGAYAAVVMGGESKGDFLQLGDGAVWGWDLPIWIWLPMSGFVAAAVGVLVAPAAMKVRGLYLAIVTIGLVFIGQHLGRAMSFIAGDPESGRNWPDLHIELWREGAEGEAFIALDEDGTWFGFLEVTEEQKTYFFILALLLLMIWLAKNLQRSRTGRALQAIRDRDVAAEVMGVPERKYKTIGFAISSFYAGIGGALLAAFTGRLGPPVWSLVLSVEFIAILLIGGAGTIAGTLMGTFFVELLPEVVEKATEWLTTKTEGGGIMQLFAELLISTGPGNFGPIAATTTSPGWSMSAFQWNLVIYGVLVVVFLIFEPLGLYGIWIRIRNYWKGWPFSY
jgi:branched-chain amino acid transport system permease protein